MESKITMSDTREVMTAKISGKAADGWREYCAAHGITVTAMIEVTGQMFAREPKRAADPQRIEMIEQARKVDLERRRRRRT